MEDLEPVNNNAINNKMQVIIYVLYFCYFQENNYNQH